MSQRFVMSSRLTWGLLWDQVGLKFMVILLLTLVCWYYNHVSLIPAYYFIFIKIKTIQTLAMLIELMIVFTFREEEIWKEYERTNKY